jgi:chromosome segregation ATPase
MFRFVELSLHGWDLWPTVRVPLDRDVVMVVGPNGSGKTTIVDAIRQVLGARLSSKRRLQNYLRRPDVPVLIRAVVTNRAANGAQAFRHERVVTPEVTLACALLPGSGGVLEKRFAILPGRPTVEEIRGHVLESRDWYGPETYGRALERAGVTRSLMQVLAIEQGRTNALFELRPRDLFQQVMEMLGDRIVLERYRDARRRYELSQGEVARQMLALQSLQVQLEAKRREAKRLDEWEAARDKVQELEERLPAAELQQTLKARDDAGSKIPELRTKVQRGQAELVRVNVTAQRARETLVTVRSELEIAKREESSTREAWGDARAQEAVAVKRIEGLEHAEREAACLPEGHIDALEQAASVAMRAAFEDAQALERAQAALGEASSRVERLRQGLAVYPEAVERMLEATCTAGIDATLFATAAEVIDPARAEAVEAALGLARYSLVVAPADEARAVELARELGFPGPIYWGERLAEETQAGPLTLFRGAPSWIPGWLERVTLGTAGLWHDERGAWVAGAAERVLGAAGREAALTQAEEVCSHAQEAVNVAEARARASTHARDVSATAIETERRRRALLNQVAEMADARRDGTAAQNELSRAKARLSEATSAREAIDSRFAAASQESALADKSLHEIETRLAGESEALGRAESESASHEARILDLTGLVGPELIKRAQRGELDGPDTVRADLDRAKEAFLRLGQPPAPEVREEARHLEGNIAEAEQHVERCRRQAADAQAELGECRRRYLDVVVGALADYRRRAVVLGAGADVTVQMRLPRLEDDDRVLDEAEIHVEFGFDGKDPLPLGDPSFSGGQQVIAGLVLLMAMAETEGDGFFILDEPFAHLSIDRVDDVGRFLRSARAQFILTTPTTLDRAQLDPASLVIVLSKKRPGDTHAPRPVVAVA